MIRKALILKLFNSAYMQRWNDKIRPMELTELDKQAHKMMIAYFLGKFEENKQEFDWIKIIEGGIFDLLQRIMITDLKPATFHKIEEDHEKYTKLNKWVYDELKPILLPLGKPFCKRFREHLFKEDKSLNRRILNAAHFYATNWEFTNIIAPSNPTDFELDEIRRYLSLKADSYDLQGISQLRDMPQYRHFIDMCGQLRFQSRWAFIHRVPKTSVLGHSLFVAMLSYLFSLETKGCEIRRKNNYFTGLFHDLPEVLTRDVVSPVKDSVKGLRDLLKEYEREMMEKRIYGLIPPEWRPEIKRYAENEFANIITDRGREKVTAGNIKREFNKNQCNPRDGQLIKAVDEFSAFIEAYEAIRNGSPSEELQNAKIKLKKEYKDLKIANINFGEIFSDFD